jgi:UDP-N-acetylglucosamine--N-acetylmuramyl-(pentapeptide) pyrophosphoryl-undecaprenol N-acetylglucosamine transferase
MIYASDLVISLAGRSTIDEILASGTPYIIVPVKGHFEQEENARGLGFSFEDLERLEDLISDKLEEGRKNPRHYGPEKAVSEILGVIEGMPSPS